MLHHAARLGHLHVVVVLLEAGSNMLAKNKATSFLEIYIRPIIKCKYFQEGKKAIELASDSDVKKILEGELVRTFIGASKLYSTHIVFKY